MFDERQDSETQEQPSEKDEIRELREDRNAEIPAEKLKQKYGERGQNNSEECLGTRALRVPPYQKKDECEEKEEERVVELHRVDRDGIAHAEGIHHDTPRSICRLSIRMRRKEHPYPVKREPEGRCREKDIQPLQESHSLKTRRPEENERDPDGTAEKAKTTVPENEDPER